MSVVEGAGVFEAFGGDCLALFGGEGREGFRLGERCERGMEAGVGVGQNGSEKRVERKLACFAEPRGSSESHREDENTSMSNKCDAGRAFGRLGEVR